MQLILLRSLIETRVRNLYRLICFFQTINLNNHVASYHILYI